MVTFETRDPKTLRNHLLSIKIYGQEKPSDDFLESVAAHGVLVPLVILPDGTIIAGHTRKFAAIIKGLSEVPCLVRSDLEHHPLLVERLVIQSNRQRIKAGDVVAKEAYSLSLIEAICAENREKLGTKADPSQISDQGISGRTTEKVGTALGFSKFKAEEAIQVGGALTTATAKGDMEFVNTLTAEARKSIHQAAMLLNPKKARKKAKKAGKGSKAPKALDPSIPANLKPIFEWREKFRAFEKLHNPAILELAVGFAHEVSESGEGSLDHTQVDALMAQVYRLIMPWQPEKVCSCGGDKVNSVCTKCAGRGWTRKGASR